jgi:hypothetical protein
MGKKNERKMDINKENERMKRNTRRENKEKMKKQVEEESKIEVKEKILKIKNILSSHEKGREERDEE